MLSHKVRCAIVLIASTVSRPVLADAPSASRAAGDPAHGKAVYAVCMGCHSLDENDVGPKHRGVIGRVAGSVPGYAYSQALKDSGITWSQETLDRWLTNPQKFVPGVKMFFAMPNEKDRADVIAYLSEQQSR